MLLGVLTPRLNLINFLIKANTWGKKATWFKPRNLKFKKATWFLILPLKFKKGYLGIKPKN
jgi:hypothetical protein